MWRTIQCRLAPSNAHSYFTQYVLLVSFSHYFQRCIAKCCQLVKRTHTHTTDTLTSSFQFKSIQNGLLAYKQPTRKKIIPTTAKQLLRMTMITALFPFMGMNCACVLDQMQRMNQIWSLFFTRPSSCNVVLKETFYACSHMAHRIHRQLQ